MTGGIGAVESTWKLVLSIVYLALGAMAVAFGLWRLADADKSLLHLFGGVQILVAMVPGVFLVKGALDDLAELLGGAVSKAAIAALPALLFVTGLLGSWRMMKIEPALNSGLTTMMALGGAGAAALAVGAVYLGYRSFGRLGRTAA